MIIESTLKAKLIYIFGIDDKTHEGCLKIGEATLDENADLFTLSPNCEALNNAAHKRISQYTQTAGIQYHLFHTELAMRTKDKQIQGFNDKAVHDVLLHSGLKRKDFNLGEGKASEWFIVDLNTAIAAIKAVKANKEALDGSQITIGQTPIILRNEQRAAIDQTKTRFIEGDQMLWNAKMRFGKTLTALQLFKELSQAEPKQYRRMLILTHRPVVNDGWFDDFHKIFFEVGTPYLYGSKTSGNSFQNLEAKMKADKECRYVYFASIQDLRGSSLVGGKFQKNDELFSAHWDLLVIDEAHEGTQTDLGDKVLKALTKKGTKTLSLSGTPFNLFGKFKQDDIYTWSYVDEQREKEKWEKEHEGDHNPYGSLPRMNMFTYDLGPLFERFQDSEYSFNFHEFFRTDDNGYFVHEEHVDRFLDMMCDPSNDSNYPFSTKRYQEYFRHTFWLVPGVKEALALQHKLEKHPIFCNFDVVNVAGDGDPDDPKGEALQKVRDAISEKPKKDYTITLSCGKLTTGVTVKEWTAVFMLSGSAKTGAANYMQTIFRVQSPGQINGKQKTDAYVFDFAPDRVLTMMAQAAKAPTRPGKQTEEHRQRLKELLNFFPIIALQGSQTRRYDVDQLLTRLKHTYIERVVNSGFDNNSLYNDRLLELDDVEIEEFDELKGIIGSTPSQDSGKDIVINDSGFDEEETGGDDRTEKKPKTPLTDEEKAARKEMKKKKEMRKNAISILRGISIRMPMLIYGCDLKDGEDITIDNFAEHIDPRSWEEFMPQGITKQHFNTFKKYYDPEIFLEAGRQIRARARKADGLPVKERIRHIVEIFSSFRNPDKETVLTPWRVVNMHLSDTIGGYDFYEETHTEMLNEPRLVDRGSVTNRVFMGQDTRILELNSKSGLYPLYMAYSIWRERCREWERQGFFEVDKMTIEEEQLAWDDVIANNIFVVCKTPMAVSITKRTLTGFRDVKQVNARYYADLVETLKTNPKSFTKDVVRGQYFWHNKNAEKEMKFNAIVGNPPYQVMDGGNAASALPVYQYFVETAKLLSPNYASIIIPAKWYSGGRNLDEFRKNMLNDKRIAILHDITDSRDLFPSADIAGGLCYFLWNKEYQGNCLVTTHNYGHETTSKRDLSTHESFIRFAESFGIISKVEKFNEPKLSIKVYPQRPFGLRTFVTPLESGDIMLRYNKGKGPYQKDLIQQNQHLIDKWKVITSRTSSEHAGQADKEGRKKILSATEVLAPGEICTETYILIDTFETEREATNCLNYLKGNFARILISAKVTAQMVSQDSFSFVPLQDFSEPWTDEKLYAKYGITPDEQAYIESLIKPME
ncbi:MAG: Eco57I restriction-modification methylase domain-containing protein [Bacteroidaceae bacterium]|nr:Eco57I restriction-modification methylase domain-containing protein [Bacteroidaceae bacterium]